MNLKITIYILITLFILISCTNDKNTNIDKLLLYRKDKSATEIEWLNHTTFSSDSTIQVSFDMNYKNKLSQHKYELPKKSATYEYKNIRNNEVRISKLDSIKTRTNGEFHTIYKYKYDVLNSIDEEAILYYTKKYGILRIDYYNWSNHSILINDKMNNKGEIYFLNETIRERLQPYKPWTRKQQDQFRKNQLLNNDKTKSKSSSI